MSYPVLTGLPHVHSGKVRETYGVDQTTLLMLATDRVSAFDVIMGESIPGKGKVLTDMTIFWLKMSADIVPNHMTDRVPEEVVALDEAIHVIGRSMVVKKLKPIPCEAVVRGYLTGSGWKEYQETGMVCGIELPAGLKNGQKLEKPIFTPSTKAPAGEHDQNVSFEQMADIIGRERISRIREVSLLIFEKASQHALSRGIILADTKFEYGLDQYDVLTLMDEVLTPDSSRYWPVEGYETAFAAGKNPPSYDKQHVRDYLEALRIDGKPWNKTAPAPALPRTVIAETAEKYRQAHQAICFGAK